MVSKHPLRDGRPLPVGRLFIQMKIEHIALWVRNLEQMRNFYETYFDAVANDKYVNSSKGFSSYFLTFPDGDSRLEIMQMVGIPDSGNDPFAQFLGLIHIAISVGIDILPRLKAGGFP